MDRGRCRGPWKKRASNACPKRPPSSPRRVAVIHSALTDAERAAEWRRIRAGELDVVVGSRSAVFAPLERLGIVVVDEEDASAYKQDRVPRYHAVDVALMLGDLCGVP